MGKIVALSAYVGRANVIAMLFPDMKTAVEYCDKLMIEPFKDERVSTVVRTTGAPDWLIFREMLPPIRKVEEDNGSVKYMIHESFEYKYDFWESWFKYYHAGNGGCDELILKEIDFTTRLCGFES